MVPVLFFNDFSVYYKVSSGLQLLRVLNHPSCTELPPYSYIAAHCTKLSGRACGYGMILGWDPFVCCGLELE